MWVQRRTCVPVIWGFKDENEKQEDKTARRNVLSGARSVKWNNLRRWYEYFRNLRFVLPFFVCALLWRRHKDYPSKNAKHKAANMCKVAYSGQNPECTWYGDGDNDIDEVFRWWNDFLPILLQVNKKKSVQPKKCSGSSSSDLLWHENGGHDVASNSWDYVNRNYSSCSKCSF